MTSFESKAAKIINNFNVGNLSLWKFKTKMLLAFIDLQDIVDRSEETPPSNLDSKVLKEYQRRIKRKQCPSSASTWQTINFCISRIAKDMRRCAKFFALFMN
jgi:hypothetical protein